MERNDGRSVPLTLKKIYEPLFRLATKSVRGTVTLAESRQGLVELYFFLFNVSQHLSKEVT
jgi:hypothetical protein